MRDGQIAEFLLQPQDGPGGWHVALETHRVFTARAQEREVSLNAEIAADLKALGLSKREHVLRMFRNDNPTPAEKAYAALEADPANYRVMALGDELKSLMITAVTINGPPDGVEEFSTLDLILSANLGEDCLSGRHVEVYPEVRAGAKNVGLKSVWTTTQSGAYRVDLHVAAGTVARIDAFRVSDAKDRPVGRFLSGAQGFEADYPGARTSGEPIDYTIRNVRDMNGIIGSLMSLNCVLGMEFPKEEQDDTPAP